jgi:hypothetical protein
MSAYTNPAISDFKAYFTRDFTLGGATGVQDLDITNALTDASITVNSDLFCTQANFTVGSLLLAAHFLTLSLRASSQGLNGQFTWLQSSKSVGSVSESFAIPQHILDNPYLAMLSRTYYGAKYLFMIMPYMYGQVFVLCSDTNP